MKRILLLSTLFLGLISIYGQTPITLTFIGKDSISQNNISLDSVYVKNMDELCDTILYGPAPVFLLMANYPVGINEPGSGKKETIILKQNYPNPFQGSTYVNIYKENQGSLNLLLYDELGAKLAEYHHDLDNGSHSFMITSSRHQVLFLVAFDNKSYRSVKIVSTGNGNEGSAIRYLGTKDQLEKSMAVGAENTGFIFYLGNQLMYTAYSEGFQNNTILDSPTESTTYTFNMGSLNIETIPTVSTAAVTNITQTTATSGGNVISDGGATVTARGVCWNTSPNPTTSNSHTTDGGGTGSFVSYLTGLAPNTLYYIRAYAINSVGIGYGYQMAFSTLPNQVLPTVTTSTVTDITQTTATSGGNVISDGGATVTARGVCWSTSPNPTTSNSHTTDGSGTGTFVSYLTGLALNTLYYVRAYAINSVGIGYGYQMAFSTLPNPVLPTVTTSTVTDVTQTTATCGGYVISDGGATVTARGVCWNTSPNPTTSNSHTTDGGGTGSFVSYLTGLAPNTQYYVRAYATNSVGTSYGNEENFTTIQLGVHFIGESFGGGIIFYLDITGQHGLIASTSDQSLSEWGCYGTFIGGTDPGIGMGQANTTSIVNGCGASGIAARICDDLVLNGYNDWFLPSIDELYLMYIHRNVIGNFDTSMWPYWSSTEYDKNYAYIVTFWGGGQYIWEKTEPDNVRAIRAF